MKPHHDAHTLFFDEMPKVGDALVACAAQAQAAATELVRQLFVGVQAHDVFPALRRAEFETRASAIVLPGVSVRSRMNRRRTSGFVELSTAGASVTALTRSEAPQKLPAACYRATRAKASQTALAFFVDDVPPPDNANEKVYGCFVYGGPGMDLTLAKLYFPIPGAHLHAIPPLDLLQLRAEIVANESARIHGQRPSEDTVELALALKAKSGLRESDG